MDNQRIFNLKENGNHLNKQENWLNNVENKKMIVNNIDLLNKDFQSYNLL